MSHHEDRSQVTSEDHPKTPAGKSSNGSGAMITFLFIVGVAASMIVGWVIFPKLLYSQKKQPVDFNHALHVEEVDDSCQSCHYFREDGTFSGIPEMDNCIECHEEVMGETEEEARFVEEYVETEKEVPWKVYSRQPDSVFFSHVAHVQAAGMECTACHGNMETSESPRIYEENRITGYSRDIWGKNIGGFKTNSWDRMKMDDCSECHRKENVNQNSVQTGKGGCLVCHK